MGFQKEYQEKLTTAEAIAAQVKSGESIKLGYFTAKPVVLIQEVAKGTKS
jgi:acyl CoA:acetate/3-ketoacid CoA transferase alpha subunit